MGLGSPTFFWEGAALSLSNFELCPNKLNNTYAIRIGSIIKVNCFCVRLRTTSYIHVLKSVQCMMDRVLCR